MVRCLVNRILFSFGLLAQNFLLYTQDPKLLFDLSTLTVSQVVMVQGLVCRRLEVSSRIRLLIKHVLRRLTKQLDVNSSFIQLNSSY